jgi:DNA-binding response OmpR family regulator
LASLRRAFPDWEVEAVRRATALSLEEDWNPGPAALLVVGVRDRMAETLALCRGLRCQAGRAHAPLLVLVSSAHEDLARAALGAGVHSCLTVPVHVEELVGVVARARQGNRPGGHTSGLGTVQRVIAAVEIGDEHALEALQ